MLLLEEVSLSVHRRRRAQRLRMISERLVHRHPYGSHGHARGRHALYLAILLEMRVSAPTLGELRRRSVRDLRAGHWFERPGREEIPCLDVSGEVVIGVPA